MRTLLFNPRSADGKHRLPNSILQVAASINKDCEVTIIDGNMEEDPWTVLKKIIEEHDIDVFGCTVMPGPQLKQAIPFSKQLKKQFPKLTIVWGGYFASNQCEVVLKSGYVDYVVNGMGDITFPKLINAIANKLPVDDIKNLIYLQSGKVHKTAKDHIPNLDELPSLPYKDLDNQYGLESYLAKTFMGNKTLSYHSSFGCPFTCSFCAVVPIYNARWKGMSAKRIMEDVNWFKDEFDIDAIEFHDNNFFTARKRTVEFAKLMLGKNISWWGEGRIDTINQYTDEDLQLMSDSGLKMIFLGAETGNDEVLKQMDKGGTLTGAEIKSFAARMKRFDIVPEYSFVLGMPADTEEEVMKQIDFDIDFIKQIKNINPNTEIIIYVYSPVPTDGSDLYEEIQKQGFHFPEKLEDWLSPSWEKFDQRKNPLTPWLTPKMIDKIRNFETVLNGYYPTASDFRIKGWKKHMLKGVSALRYKTGVYNYPYEIKAMHKFWKYRQPEEQGFYSE